MVDYIPPKIPAAVVRFANKNDCKNLTKNDAFNRPFYGYKGYDVYMGDSANNEKDCIILYKYGFTRFAKSDEIPQIFFWVHPPLPPGLWLQNFQYKWNLRQYHKN